MALPEVHIATLGGSFLGFEALPQCKVAPALWMVNALSALLRGVSAFELFAAQNVRQAISSCLPALHFAY